MDNFPNIKCWNCQADTHSGKAFALVEKMVLCDECLIKMENERMIKKIRKETG